MSDVQVTVSLPSEAAALSQGLQKLVLDLVAAKKSGLSGVALATAGVSAAVADLEPSLAALGGLGAEVSAEPLGVVEAFALAGFGVGRALTQK